jgi:chemotaxis protein MotC
MSRALPIALAAMLATAATTGTARAEAAALEPYQMVRSLQLVQDRVAIGDHAALPIQRKLLEMIDARIRRADPQTLGQTANLRALLIYAMSGGNPETFRDAVDRMELPEADSRLAVAVMSYLHGASRAAEAALKPIDPMAQPRELASFLALIKGSVISLEDPSGALKLLDKARLLSPGTLVEEAALRRSIALAATVGDAARFAHACDQYVRAYLRSPYASQFADALVNGIITLHKSIDRPAIDATIALMSMEQRKVVYLRIARRAAIEGLVELSNYAAERAEAVKPPSSPAEDPRVLLYTSLTTVTTEPMEIIRDKLGRIDRSSLSAGDRELLDALTAMTEEISAAPTTRPEPQRDPAPPSAEAPAPEGTPEPRVVEAPPPPREDGPGDLPPTAENVSAQPGGVASAAAEATPADAPSPAEVTPVEPQGNGTTGAQSGQDVATADAPVASGGETEASTAADATIADVRSRLGDIDKLLSEAAE